MEKRKMKSKKNLGTLLLSALVLIPILLFIGNVLSNAENPEWSKVVFFVSWYDVGEEVLEGLKGVDVVNKGFQNSTETNIVWYDPALINIDEMQKALEDAGTYLGAAN